MVAEMTGSGKTVWVQSLLQQAETVIDQSPERIMWCYSQWQNAYTQLLIMIPTIEFVVIYEPSVASCEVLCRIITFVSNK